MTSSEAIVLLKNAGYTQCRVCGGVAWKKGVVSIKIFRSSKHFRKTEGKVSITKPLTELPDYLA